MHSADKHISYKLNGRHKAGNLRTLRNIDADLIDFASNDYLGFARSERLYKKIEKELLQQQLSNGSTGSRLLSGNSIYAEELEKFIADYHGHQAGLLFNSGYDANIGVLSSLPQRGDTVICDELIHASIIDGTRLSNAYRYNFKHNNIDAFREKLQHAKGNIYVVVESVYSMDGDSPDIPAMVNICKEFDANLIIDEAHAIGVFGKGLVDNLGLQEDVFARVITYGKAMGVHGAIVLGSKQLRDYLINFSRPFIYTTAAPIHQLTAIKMAYEMLADSHHERQSLTENVSLFNHLIDENLLVASNQSAIHCIKAGSNGNARLLSAKLTDSGIDVRPILSPTVAEGSERLRICLHAYNTANEIKLLTQELMSLK